MRELHAEVSEQDNGIRVWKFVLHRWKDIVKSREHMRKCFKRGEVTVNGHIAEVTKILATKDVVQLKFDSHAAHESIYGKEKLDVRFEDDDLAVVIKPSGRTMVAFGFMLPFSLSASSIKEDEEESHKDTACSQEQLLEAQRGDQQDASHVLSDGNDEEEGENDDDEGMDIPFNISPTLGQQSRLPCAIHGLEKASNGLILVAKTKRMRTILLGMHKDGSIARTFRVICHGDWHSTDSLLPDSQLGENESAPRSPNTHDADCIKSVRVMDITPSNEAGSLSTLEVIPHSPYMGVNIRRYLLSMQHPVVGESGNTRPLKANRGKGLLSALVRVEFVHPRLGTWVVAQLDEPAKFEQLRNREQRACLRRQANDQEELRKGGLEQVVNYDRKADRPIAYLVGEKDFYNMRFKVSPATLIPRSSTETLVDAAISLVQKQERRINILDVGTGSGCLLLALLQSLPCATGTGVDISEDALEMARKNSALHDLSDRASFVWADLGDLRGSRQLLQSFDLLVCNPPYLDSSKASKLKMLFAGTEYEPPVALFAEKEGYGAYELLAASLLRDLEAPLSARIMRPAGHVVLEIGSGMGCRVREIFKFMRFEHAFKDAQDSERCLVFSLPGSSEYEAPSAAAGCSIIHS
ncbi:hypothetical protein BGX28_000890 [Mortierella sp. GBA30]|nr:hypothetical protein BGX28_000890 [Mortierella sp. GBA30]